MKFLMISYKGNQKEAERTKAILKLEWDVDAEIIYGYKLGEKGSTKNTVLMQGVVDKLLPRAIELKDDIVYIEDDVRFTRDPRLLARMKAFDVIWAVYRKGKLTNKPPHNVITGSQAIYMNKKTVKKVYDWFKNRKPIHIDSAFSEVFRQPDIKFLQAKKSMGYERIHESLISKDDWSKYANPR